MKRFAVLIGMVLPVSAHVVSMSTGEAKLDGPRLDYELRMPLYEVAHLSKPEPQLFDAIRFRAAGADARLLEHSCREEGANLACRGVYQFDRVVDQFDVECGFAAITVPNHVHLLRAIHGDRTDQAAFDGSFTAATIRFRPPTRIEIALRDASAGFWRAIAGLAQLLFVAALVLAGRSVKELLGLTVMFIAGQAAVLLLRVSMRVAVSPRFIEAAAALTIAYLAVEILLLPHAGRRWLVVGVLGSLHGVYFDLLVQSGDYSRVAFASGVFAAEASAIAAMAVLARLARRVGASVRSPLMQRGLASVLLIVGLSWFVLRLWT